ncbi:MAG TPA: cation:proton antiporter, partial [Pyrinomonadaceae bacterium]|nr:cation:proton antiporter [Pyrinomonadaceae bacterium]
LQTLAFWGMLDFLLNNLLFLVTGLQLPRILEGLAGQSAWTLTLDAVLISLAVIFARILWVFPATYLPRLLSKSLREHDPYPGWRNVLIVAWTGLRGAVALAAALALPYATSAGAPFPDRDRIIFLAFAVIVATLVLQGLSLAPLIRFLGLRDDGTERREEARARAEIAGAALRRIEALAAEDNLPEGLVARLRADYEHRLEHAEADRSEGEGGQEDGAAEADGRTIDDARRARAEVLRIERETLLRLREEGVIGDEAMHAIERDLDLEEAGLRAAH